MKRKCGEINRSKRPVQYASASRYVFLSKLIGNAISASYGSPVLLFNQRQNLCMHEICDIAAEHPSKIREMQYFKVILESSNVSNNIAYSGRLSILILPLNSICYCRIVKNTQSDSLAVAWTSRGIVGRIFLVIFPNNDHQAQIPTIFVHRLPQVPFG